MGLAGRRQEARSIAEALEGRRTEEYVTGTLIAAVWVGLGEYDQAISWLLKALEDHDCLLPYVNVQPTFDPLRADPRFQDILRKMNFPSTA